MPEPEYIKHHSELILLYNINTGRIELSSGRNIFAEFTGKNEKETIELFCNWVESDQSQNLHNNWAICTGLKQNREYNFMAAVDLKKGPPLEICFRAKRGKGDVVVILVNLKYPVK